MKIYNATFSPIRQLWNNQIVIYAVFVLIMIVPNILLCVTDEYPTLTVLCVIMIPIGFYMLWALVTPLAGWMILLSLPLMIFGAFQIVLLYLFGGSVIAVDMFTNLFTTNVSEAGELLGNIMPAVIGVCVLYVPLIVLGIRSMCIKEKMGRRLRIRLAISGVAILFAGGVFGCIAKQTTPDFGVKYHLFPVNVMYNIQLTLDKWKLSQAYHETSKDFSFNAIKGKQAPQREIYVLVIGEASRAANWELFGYERPTNPLLSKRDGLVPFSRVTTQNNATHKSVPLMLAPVSADNFSDIYSEKSVITAFKEAGFKTIYISNQVPNRSLIDFFSEEADSRVDISPRESELYTESRPDGEMLSYIRKAIEASNDNMLIVLHTYGSHFNFNKRYPAEFAKFTPDHAKAVNRRHRQEVVNSYDNSILYTDYVLDGIISILDSTQVCTALLYSADHGEDLMDDSRHRFLHASPTPTYYQLHVAALAWFSEPYRTAYQPKYQSAMVNSQKSATTANVFHTLTDMAAIRGNLIDSTQSLLNASYHPSERKYLNDHYKAVTFEQSGLKTEDFEMLKRHGIN